MEHAANKRPKIENDSVGEFAAWCATEGARFSRLRFVHSESFGNHMVAADEISGRTAIVTLPRKFLMSTSNAVSSPTAGEALRRLVKQWGDLEGGLPLGLRSQTACDRFCVLALLCHEAAKGENSWWAPYIRLLPPPKTVPALVQMTPEQLKESGLLGTILGAQVEAVWEEVAAQVGLMQRLHGLDAVAFPAEATASFSLFC